MDAKPLFGFHSLCCRENFGRLCQPGGLSQSEEEESAWRSAHPFQVGNGGTCSRVQDREVARKGFYTSIGSAHELKCLVRAGFSAALEVWLLEVIRAVLGQPRGGLGVSVDLAGESLPGILAVGPPSPSLAQTTHQVPVLAGFSPPWLFSGTSRFSCQQSWDLVSRTLLVTNHKLSSCGGERREWNIPSSLQASDFSDLLSSGVRQ